MWKVFVFLAFIALASASGCTASHNYATSSETGGFGCDYYTDMITVTWLIQLEDSRIFLEFTDFDTEANYDFVKVYDGSNNDAPLLGSFSGSVIPGPFISSGNSLFISFHSDQYVQGSGFHADWHTFSGDEGVTQCGSNQHQELTGSEGNFGCAGYNNNIDTTWLITGNDNERIVLNFDSFNTEYNYDLVTVYDGNSENAENVGVFSGDDIPPPITASGNQLYVTFHSDYSITSTGFSCSWTSLVEFSDPCYNNTNQIILGREGYVGCPFGYGNNVESTWLIRVLGNFIIELNFLTLDLEAGYDFVDVYDGSSSEAVRLGHFTGIDTPSPVRSSGNAMYVVLSTDYSTTASGFTATYHSVHALQENGCARSGTFVLTGNEDSIGCEGYLAGVTEEWHIVSGSPDQVVSLEWQSFDTEEGHDIVYVYDGNSTSSPLLYNWSGSSLPDPAVSSQGTMLVKFIADDNGVQGSGFAAVFDFVAVESNPNSCSSSHDYHLTGQEGVFGCDGYADGVSVSWSIEVDEGYIVLLDFTTFFTESGYDFVSIYDGPNANSPSLGSWSGVFRPPALSSSSRFLYVQFTSDEGVNRAGFSAEYSSYFTGSDAGDCFNDQSFTLTDPTGSFGCDGYGDNVHVSWSITTAPGTQIGLDFASFQTEYNYDTLSIYDGSGSNAHLLATYSGYNIPAPVRSTSNHMYVVFSSDSSVQYDGFNANYHTIEEASSLSACTSSTSQTLTAPAGEFGCDGYSNSIDASWTIRVAEGQRITLTFSQMDTELYYDYVKVFDGSSSSATLFGTYSGNSIPSALTSSGNTLYVTFHSDSSVSSFNGFAAEYVSFGSFLDFCDTDRQYTFTESSGSFGCDGYANSVTVSWAISSFGNIALHFDHFETESNYDLLTVYDGPSQNSPVIATYSGSYAPALISSGNALFIVFTSDVSVTRPGFSANYETVAIDYIPPHHE